MAEPVGMAVIGDQVGVAVGLELEGADVGLAVGVVVGAELGRVGGRGSNTNAYGWSVWRPTRMSGWWLTGWSVVGEEVGAVGVRVGALGGAKARGAGQQVSTPVSFLWLVP